MKRSFLVPAAIALYLLFSMVSISASQIMLGIAFILWIIYLIRSKQKISFPGFFWPLLAYIFLSLVACIFSDNPQVSLIDSRELLLFLIVPLVYTGFQKIKDIVNNLDKSMNFFFLARGISIATAKEGGLKLKEIACRFIEGYSAAHAKHGPISLVREGFPIIFIAPPDETYERLLGNVMEFKARGGQIISVVVESDETITDLSDVTIRIPQPRTKYYNIFSPITFIPSLQLLAYYSALKHALNPDQPLNLAKTVTVH